VLVPLACAGVALTATDLALRRRGHHRNVLVRVAGAACLTLVLPATVAVAHPGWISYAFVAWGLTLAYFATRLVSIRAATEVRWRGRAADAWRSVVYASQAALYAMLLPLVAGGVVTGWLLLAFAPGTVAALRRPGAATMRATGYAEIPHLAWFVLAVIGTYHLR
jgi:hypothetical protein